MKNILITGANRGVGLELVCQLMERNDVKMVFATARVPDKAKLGAGERTPDISHMTVTDDNSIQSGIGQVTKLLPKDEGLNVLINNSGILSADQSFEKASRPVMRDHYDVMVIGPMKVTQYCLPLLYRAADANKATMIGPQRACVINITDGLASMQECTGTFGGYAYRCAKTALNMETKMLSIDLKKRGIMVVALCPGMVRTDLKGQHGGSVSESVSTILQTIDKLSGQYSGMFLRKTGEPYLF